MAALGHHRAALRKEPHRCSVEAVIRMDKNCLGGETYFFTLNNF